MGLLTVGEPLNWSETEKVIDYVKKHGIEQFINLYHKLKERHGDCLKWGDEIEYNIVKFDHENKKVHLALKGEQILEKLMSEESKDPSKNEFLWRPEYASYMLEGTPGRPYGGLLHCFNVVEGNMKNRRKHLQSMLEKDEVLLTIGAFPRLGCPDFCRPNLKPSPDSGVTRSLFFPDDAIFKAHPRFKNLTRNIRERRGEKVVINVPVYRDEKTPMFLESDEDLAALGDERSGGEAKRARKPYHIYMDAMGFGMGCCCLQVTFQTVNVCEARWLYDQLTPITPVLLALSASTPIFRGYLADVDSRWNIISASVDDRTQEERGLKPLNRNKFVIKKSRYDTTDCYLYGCSAAYNDVDLQFERQHYDRLMEGGVDNLLARHVAHMFIRDPLQVYRERVEQDDQASTEHFETIQSSNWLNMRFKPPPLNEPNIGWRVEFRPTEVQLTDFENAAYVCFVVLLTRVIVSFRLTFLIPISKVGENMNRAQIRDAVNKGRFYFRRTLTTCDSPPEVHKTCGSKSDDPLLPPSTENSPTKTATSEKSASEDIIEMTIDEIVNGKPPHFPGLAPLIQQYLDSAEVDVDTRCTIEQYIRFVQARASGRVFTLAKWMRTFVLQHPTYKHDSRITEEINYDLIKTMDDIAQGRAHCPCLLGDFRSKSRDVSTAAVSAANEMYKNYARQYSNVVNSGADSATERSIFGKHAQEYPILLS